MTLYTTFNTPFCRMILVGTTDAVSGLHLDTGEGKRAFSIDPAWIRNESAFGDAREQIEAYCSGRLKRFSLALEVEGTEFQQGVWSALQDIPFGEVRTYGEIAAAIGNEKASRAVGMANSNNPLPLIIPCHRVIGADGSLTGFAHGLSIKRRLLEFERQDR
ncbi:methylated-DNA--[protein]-cysteine S-methyltransferase [Desulfogranum mediterraneum]|uniref:methylated-DNA--[protein]-cysteine S-methyltransferase n=1 Tax=Desulfogranum mediterraneum TaxID=160661 RepID=UPI0003FD3BB9|nr:methylated-DNA--[protein]-cysteine S-methyltransferase [Desulfogranum mediterraneum]